ncbi:MAG: FAD/NAD(P)-binding oxidoreductase [Myxococcota bacterium]
MIARPAEIKASRESFVHIVIIGNGITGITAARGLRRKQPDWRITVISGESDYHYSRPALMYIFMGHMRLKDTRPDEPSVWQRERIELLRAWVTGIDVDAKRVGLHDGETLTYDKLLLATGSRPKKFGWKGQDLEGVQGFYDLQDLERLYKNSQGAEHAVIVGGGLIGIELAEMLHSRNIHVTFLVREKSFWDNILPAEESAMINRLIRASGMRLELECELDEIVGVVDHGIGRACAVVTNRGERIACQLVGLTAGVSPNLSAVKSSKIDIGRGILVDWSFATSAPDVFAAGDCAELVKPEGERNVIEQVWYTGRAHGEVVADILAGCERTYRQGIWFNSAKFLDLEYQVYGAVGRNIPGERNLYWEHPRDPHALRIVYQGDNKGDKVIGFNLMGLRYRHEVCERWIKEERPVRWVLDHLEEASFDSELFERFEGDIRQSLRQSLDRQQAA